MASKKHLFVGFGDIARRCADLLSAKGDTTVGIARTVKPTNISTTLWQGAVSDPHILALVGEQTFDSVVITLTPGGRTRDAYRAAYYDSVKALVNLWESGEAKPPKHVFFVSSTSVYGQSRNEWVDESSPTTPVSETAKVLGDTERLLLDSAVSTTVIRFSGIYGKGRNYLLKQVANGIAGDDKSTNRIHIDDCSGSICYLIEQLSEGRSIAPVYLLSDSEPVSSRDIRQWLTKKMRLASGEEMAVNDFSTEPEIKENGLAVKEMPLGKRCSNKKIIALGYQFLYPSYREGYLESIDDYLRNKK